MEDKDQMRILLQVLNQLQAESRTLRKALAQEGEHLLLQQWRRCWEWERREQRLLDARN